jgi:hypothetical protein
MKTFNLTEEQVDLICEELRNANEADRDGINEVDEEEAEYLTAAITARNEIMSRLRS